MEINLFITGTYKFRLSPAIYSVWVPQTLQKYEIAGKTFISATEMSNRCRSQCRALRHALNNTLFTGHLTIVLLLPLHSFAVDRCVLFTAMSLL
jgi:hypothetical protein